jgi:hypothetical protein
MPASPAYLQSNEKSAFVNDFLAFLVILPHIVEISSSILKYD